jgi:hypothetical protein
MRQKVSLRRPAVPVRSPHRHVGLRRTCTQLPATSPTCVLSLLRGFGHRHGKPPALPLQPRPTTGAHASTDTGHNQARSNAALPSSTARPRAHAPILSGRVADSPPVTIRLGRFDTARGSLPICSRQRIRRWNLYFRHQSLEHSLGSIRRRRGPRQRPNRYAHPSLPFVLCETKHPNPGYICIQI